LLGCSGPLICQYETRAKAPGADMQARIITRLHLTPAETMDLLVKSRS
jgi:hypothetical protein